jgi:hypothetical protein
MYGTYFVSSSLSSILPGEDPSHESSPPPPPRSGSSDRHLQKDDQVDIDNEACLQYYYFLHEEEVQQWWSKRADASNDSRETRIERERECRWNNVDAVCSMSNDRCSMRVAREGRFFFAPTPNKLSREKNRRRQRRLLPTSCSIFHLPKLAEHLPLAHHIKVNDTSSSWQSESYFFIAK